MKPLSQLRKGEQAFIIGTNTDQSYVRLGDLGCYPGELIELHGINSNKSAYLIRCKHRLFELSADQAEAIMTNNVNLIVSLN